MDNKMIFFMTKQLYSQKWLTILICCLSLLSACNNPTEAPKQAVRTVRLETVSATDSLIKRRFTGRIDAISTVDLSFQVPGHLIQLPTQEGTVIPKGELVAALDKKDFQLAVQQAKAQHQLNKLDVIRKRNLFKSGSLPKAMLDKAETAYKLSQVALETAQRDQSYTRIIAPFDALVSQRLIDNFTNVDVHQPVIRVQELTELRVRINIPENMVKLLDKPENFKAELVFKDRPQQHFPLVYREHVTEAGSIAQTYEVVFGLSRENNQHVLPGMTVAVIITKKQDTEISQIAVPVSALDYDEQGNPRVWVFDPKTKTVSSRKVVLGTIQKHKIPVIDGLKIGEQIVTAGAHLLRENMTVRRFISF